MWPAVNLVYNIRLLVDELKTKCGEAKEWMCLTFTVASEEEVEEQDLRRRGAVFERGRVTTDW